MAEWTPEGMPGNLFRVLAEYSPPEAQVDAPVSWGDQRLLTERPGPYVNDIRIRRETVRLRSPSPAHWVEFMKTYFGPPIVAFENSHVERQRALTDEMTKLVHEYNRSPDQTVLAHSEYLEVVAIRL